ncbi:MAG: hypothetical protein WDW38_010097 [Sanguina aurantia]
MRLDWMWHAWPETMPEAMPEAMPADHTHCQRASRPCKTAWRSRTAAVPALDPHQRLIQRRAARARRPPVAHTLTPRCTS